MMSNSDARKREQAHPPLGSLEAITVRFPTGIEASFAEGDAGWPLAVECRRMNSTIAELSAKEMAIYELLQEERARADLAETALSRVKALADQWEKAAAADRDPESNTLRAVSRYLHTAIEGDQ